jgi:pimeloyl-ACP methyl ester carboxylesterase
MKCVALIPSSQITIFPEAGHLLSLEHPDKLAQVICDFLISD